MNSEIKDLSLEGQVDIMLAKNFQYLFQAFMDYIHQDTNIIPTDEENKIMNNKLRELAIAWHRVPWLHSEFRKINKQAKKFLDVLDSFKNEYDESWQDLASE